MQGSPFNPISPQERDIAHLFVGILIVGALIFALVAALVLFIAIRYRHRGETDEPYQEFGRRRLETAWTTAPARYPGNAPPAVGCFAPKGSRQG